ncbi:MAG: toxin-antitoxin system HicB family antitoxin [Anaerolineae bacterium]|nr:toxin-antitoxin system HicB family antitoxin [Anaerolineales bacterium]MCQ3971929.1 toxin-antitoxin system HicB family antitoxin [Anaerolineae bacterium]
MTEKNLDYYLTLPYPIRIYPEPDGSGYTAEVVDLPGCITCADTLPELWDLIEDAKRGWLELALADGNPIPEPSLPAVKEELSGKLTVRVPRSLHRKLIEQAQREGVSLNQFINASLAETIGLKRTA